MSNLEFSQMAPTVPDVHSSQMEDSSSVDVDYSQQTPDASSVDTIADTPVPDVVVIQGTSDIHEIVVTVLQGLGFTAEEIDQKMQAIVPHVRGKVAHLIFQHVSRTYRYYKVENVKPDVA